MKPLIQIGLGSLTCVGTLVFLFLLVTSELNFMDLRFAAYFGAFSTMAALSFFILTRNDDNEETNPGKEKVKR